METISDTTTHLHEDGFTQINLTDMAEKPAGAWPKGWYAAEIVEGYSAGSYEFQTSCVPSKPKPGKEPSFNVIICVRVTHPNGEQRTMFRQVNYRTQDFTPERIATVQNLRKEFAGQRGKWQGFEDEQRSSLALGQLGQLQTATGAALAMNSDGIINVGPFIGKKPFVRLTIDDETGYNEINAFSQYATGSEPNKKRKG